MSENNPILQVKDLTVSFNAFAGKVQAVRGVSFDLNKGETLCIVGESGSGKSVTNKAIMGILSKNAVIDRGEILYDGMDLTKLTEEQFCQIRGKRIAMVFQDPIASLNPRMTVQEIIAEGLKIKGIKDEATVRNMVGEALYRVGLLPEHATRYPHEFSGGQRQRIGIARALIVEPTMVIADEPISALDVSIQAQVINVLNDLKRDMGLTILFIAHDLSVVKYFSDTIGVMYKGRMVEMGDADKVYHNPLHPYTKSLISSIPLPNPHGERRRVRVSYDPSAYNIDDERLEMRHVEEGHSILCTPDEYEKYVLMANRG